MRCGMPIVKRKKYLYSLTYSGPFNIDVCFYVVLHEETNCKRKLVLNVHVHGVQFLIYAPVNGKIERQSKVLA